MCNREVVHCVLDKPRFGVSLFVDRLRERLSSETLEDRLEANGMGLMYF